MKEQVKRYASRRLVVGLFIVLLAVIIFLVVVLGKPPWRLFQGCKGGAD